MVGAAGVEDLFVHIMVANQAGLRFYTQHGFDIVAEESANAAHYRYNLNLLNLSQCLLIYRLLSGVSAQMQPAAQQ